MRAAGCVFKRSSGTHFPIRLWSQSPGVRPTTLFGDCADLATYLAARRDLRVHIRVRSPGTDGSDHCGKITSLELLRWLRPGDDVGRRDHSRHGALLRALRSKTVGSGLPAVWHRKMTTLPVTPSWPTWIWD